MSISMEDLFGDVFVMIEDLAEELEKNGFVVYNGFIFTKDDADLLLDIITQ